MRHFIPFLAGSSITLVLIAGACSSSNNGTGASTTTSSHATTSSSTSGTSNTSGSSTAVTSTTNSTTSNSTTTVSSASSTGVGGGGGGGVGGSGAGGGTGGTAADPFECTVPSTPPSGGSCVTLQAADAGTGGMGAGVECNPITNDGCAAGSDCDVATDSNNNPIGFTCYSGVGTDALCGACDDQTTATICANGATCFGYGNDQSACAQYCCSDADCGAGKCTTMTSQGAFFPFATTVGVCTLM